MIYLIIKYILRIYFNWVMDISVRGLDNVPEKGPAVMIANHPSTIDAFLIMSIINRKIYAFGKADFFIKPFNNWFLRSLGGIPVKNEKYNRLSLEEAEMLLHKNQIILIFPEGQVNSGTSLLPFKKSFLKLSCKLKVPIVPIIILESDNALKPGKYFPHPANIIIRILEPIPCKLPERFINREYFQNKIQNIRDRFVGEINLLKTLYDMNEI